MNGTIGEFLILLGIPSAVTGLAFWGMKKGLDRRDRRIDAQERARTALETAIVESVNASLALGEATANAVARIPDAHCNGDMHEALDYAREVKHRQKALLTKLGIESLNDDKA